MERRSMLAGLAGSALLPLANIAGEETPAGQSMSFLEVKFWRLHNTSEDQNARVTSYLQQGLGPALSRAGGQLAGVFGPVIAPEAPFILTVSQFQTLASYQSCLASLAADSAHLQQIEKLSVGSGLPFVRIESSLLRSFQVIPHMVISAASTPRIFELRMYESQSLASLTRKVGMFNNGEMKIFERLNMRPVFGGETIVGPRQPNLMYMLSFDNLDAREKLWGAFGSDPEWKRISSPPEFHDSEIVSNISNMILRPLSFSAVR